MPLIATFILKFIYKEDFRVNFDFKNASSLASSTLNYILYAQCQTSSRHTRIEFNLSGPLHQK